MKTLCLFSLLTLTSALATPIKRQLATSDTENDLTNGSPCAAVTVIFALASDIGASNLAVQGVDYPADIAGFLEGGDPTGSQTMASLVEQAFSQCPDTKVVMSGYRYDPPSSHLPLSSSWYLITHHCVCSQGGQLVHNAAKLLSSADQANVNSGISSISLRSFERSKC
jgi:cutinase